MSPKRQPESADGAGGGSPEEKRQRSLRLYSVIREVMQENNLKKFVSSLEPLFRRIGCCFRLKTPAIHQQLTCGLVRVHEEIETALRKYSLNKPRSCMKQIHPASSRSLQLQFTNKLSLPIFTGGRIEQEDCSALSVSLVDAFSGKTVTSGPESSVKVELVVLEGDFEGDEENCTYEQFGKNIVRERDGRRQLLSGDMFLNLNSGIGMAADLVFTDNSSWTRSRRFRLGAKVDMGHIAGIRIKEAMSEPFVVKDHRGELYKKHYPPCLSDDVWRLEKIGKDGAFHKRLNHEKINTVKDFLTLLFMDSQRLRSILGSGMSTKMWEVVVDHAKTCPLDGSMYLYYPPDCRMGIVFNVVGGLLGVLLDGQLVPVDELTDTHKLDVQRLVKIAHENWSEVTTYDGAVMTDDTSLHLPATNPSFRSPPLAVPPSDLSNHSSSGLYMHHPSGSFSDIFSSTLSGHSLGFNECFTPGMSENSTGCYLSSLSHLGYSDTDPSTFYKQAGSVLPDGSVAHGAFDEHLQYLNSDGASQTHCFDAHQDIGLAVRRFVEVPSKPDSYKAQAMWVILRIVLHWAFSIKRKVASRRRMMREASNFEVG